VAKRDRKARKTRPNFHPTRGGFASDLEYMLYLERVRAYIDDQFRTTAMRFTNRLRLMKEGTK